MQGIRYENILMLYRKCREGSTHSDGKSCLLACHVTSISTHLRVNRLLSELPISIFLWGYTMTNSCLLFLASFQSPLLTILDGTVNLSYWLKITKATDLFNRKSSHEMFRGPTWLSLSSMCPINPSTLQKLGKIRCRKTKPVILRHQEQPRQPGLEGT